MAKIPRSRNRSQAATAVLKRLWRHWQNLLDIFYPRWCYGCGRSLAPSANRYLCYGCWRKLSYIDRAICPRCGLPVAANVVSCSQCAGERFYFEEVRAAGEYRKLLRDLLLDFKFAGRAELGYPLTAIVERHLNRKPFAAAPDVITSVPSSFSALYRRGYNPAAVMATLLGRRLQLPYDNNLLVKIRNTPPQSGLPRHIRKTNLNRAFAVPKEKHAKIRQCIIVLADDIFTTGSTANECARQLKLHGARKVYIVTIARSIIRDLS